MNDQKVKIMEDARQLAEDVYKYVGGDEKMPAQERYRQVKDQAREQWQKAQDMWDYKRKRVDEFVNERTWTSVGIAAAVGLVLGLVMGVKKRR